MAEANDGAWGESRIVNAGIDVDAQRHMVVAANVLQMPATVPERVVEAPALPEVPDRRQVPPAVTAVGAQTTDELAAEELVALGLRECVLLRRRCQIQQLLPRAHKSPSRVRMSARPTMH